MVHFFNLEILEPRCPNCSTKVDYEVTTRYDDKKQGHVCLNCGAVL